MTAARFRAAMLLLAFGLAACAQGDPVVPAPAKPEGAAALVAAKPSELSARFIGFVGPKAQHAPPFLGVPGTNFYCLRSFLDRQTGAAAHQLYVEDSYSGPERHWDAAQDAAGDRLTFVAISADKIGCENGCSYAEEFAAEIPEQELRANPQGLAVTFTDPAGDKKTIHVGGAAIAAQLAAVERERRALPPPGGGNGAGPAPPPPDQHHQPESGGTSP